jgi:hypothetical protein
MPRIEILSNGYNESDGSPTIDVCQTCADAFFSEGEPVPLYLQKRFLKAVIGSTMVEHPPYDDGLGPERDGQYACDCCGDTLDANDH